MIRAKLADYIGLDDEIRLIAQRIVDQHAKTENAKLGKGYSKLDYYVDDINTDGYDQNKISIRMYVCGARSYSETEYLHVSTDEFCDPKWLLDEFK